MKRPGLDISDFTNAGGINSRAMRLHDARKWILAGMLLAIAVIVGCKKEQPGEPGPMEKAGKKIDEAAEKTGEYLSDSAVTAKVKAALGLNKNIDLKTISVTTTDGIVTLSGTVSSPAAKSEAAFIAGGVSGVKRVVSNLEITQ